MKRGRPPQGYTIVEVMIFLLVTGVLLASALLVFNGQQARTRFTQSVRETESQMRTTINEVGSGYYPDQGGFTCSAVGGSLSIESSDNPNEQGTNEGCIFLGKVVRFSNSSDYRVYTILGRQRVDGTEGEEVTTLSEAQPTALAAFSGDSGNTPDVTENFVIPSGTVVSKVVNESGQAISSFGFIQSLGAYQGEDLISSAQSLDLVALPGTTLSGFNPSSDSQFDSAVSGMTSANRTQRITICFSAGNRQAALIIGGEGRELSTEVIIDDVPGVCDA